MTGIRQAGMSASPTTTNDQRPKRELVVIAVPWMSSLEAERAGNQKRSEVVMETGIELEDEPEGDSTARSETSTETVSRDNSWLELIQSAKSDPLPIIRAKWIDLLWEKRNLNRSFTTVSRVTLEDKQVAYVKQSRFDPNGDETHFYQARMAVNDQVAGQMGKLMNAPVADVLLVEVPDHVRRRFPGTRLSAGVHHGSVEIKHLAGPIKEDRKELWTKTDQRANRPRFASLAILHGWLYCTIDHQFAFQTTDPKLVI